MNEELSEQDIQEILDDPAAWEQKQKELLRRAVEDARRACQQDIEDSYRIIAKRLALLSTFRDSLPVSREMMAMGQTVYVPFDT